MDSSPGKRLRSATLATLRRLPAPRDEAAIRTAVALRDLALGRAAPRPQAPARRRKARPAPARSTKLPHLKAGPPIEGMDAWEMPPRSEGHDVWTEVLYETGAAPPHYDLELFEQLNAEYADKPIVPRATSRVDTDRWEAGRNRLRWASRYLDLTGKTTLEIGCSNGYEVWLLGNNAGCDAHGIDVTSRGAWSDLEGPSVHFEIGDMAVQNPYPADTFDAVVSYAVWEHVVHPQTLLEETFKVLKPGGRAFIRANLYCGPQASHRYREIFFPWPHLLFSDDVVKEWDAKHGYGPRRGGESRGNAWVNRLTWDNYRRIVDEIGFELKHVSFQKAAWDEEFYQRFEDVLGRYPRRDLERDFFLMVVDKPRR